jgi:hypothetical protein
MINRDPPLEVPACADFALMLTVCKQVSPYTMCLFSSAKYWWENDV